MMNREQISRRDLERLSAYLDGQLENGETARLEARLREEESLRLELQELRVIAQTLGELPQLQPPRNFTLSAAAKPRRASPSTSLRPRRARSSRASYPLLQLGTAVATLSFLVVVGADVLLSRSLAAAPAAESFQAAPLAAAPAEEAAKAEPALGAAVEATAEPLAREAGAATAPTESEASQDQLEATASALGQNAEQEATEGAYADSYAEEDRARDPELAGELGTQQPEAEALARAAEASLPEAEPVGADQAPGTLGFRPPQSLFRAAEFGLGAAAVILAGFALWARRRA